MAKSSGHMDDYTCRVVSDFFTVFANTTRMRIFCSLSGKDMSVGELAHEAGVSLPNISQHLRVMRDKGVVLANKEGQSVYYRIADPKYIRGVQMIRDALINGLSTRAEKVMVR